MAPHYTNLKFDNFHKTEWRIKHVKHSNRELN